MNPAKKQQITLPDLLAICQLKGSTNPHFREAAAESSAWINSYNVFTDRKRAYFVQGCNELLVSHTYPYAGYEQFRTCCDFVRRFQICGNTIRFESLSLQVNLLFVVDEVSDDQNGQDARATGETFLAVMRDPEFNDGSILAQITKEYALLSLPCRQWLMHLFRFRSRYMRLAGPRSARRFLQHCEDYINAVAREAELRERGEVLDMGPFTSLRRENSAVRLCFSLIEYAAGIDLPDDVYDDVTFMEAYWAAIDLVCWANVKFLHYRATHLY